MSKSYGNAITLSMTPEETSAVIRRSPTDGDRRITFDPARRPGVSALLSTAALCLGVEPAALAEDIGDGGGKMLKGVTASAVNEYLAPHRERRQELVRDAGLAHDILNQGSRRANTIAEETLTEVREAMGTVY